MTKPYERLSEVYDFGWSDFSLHYVDWIDRLLAERGKAEGRILDLACGTGTLAVALVHLGYTVCGIDSSVEMINKARAKAAGLADISFSVQDIVQFTVDGKFDLVTCTFDALNYLRRKNQLRQMFRGAAAALDRSGLLIFDSNTKNLYQHHSDEVTKRELDGQQFIQYSRYDTAGNVAITAFSFSDGTYEIHRQRPYNYDELSPILAAAGFRIIKLSSWFDIVPYSPDTAKLFCVAEKC